MKNNSFKNSITVKLFIVGFLILLLLIPVSMVMGLISERAQARQNAVSEVSYKWGNAQTLAGPILTVPYKEYITATENNKKKVIEQIRYAHFLPLTLNIKGLVLPQILCRGIYEVVVYKTDLTFSGEFPPLNLKSFKINEKDVLWKDAFISFGISDMRGIKKSIPIAWNNEQFEFDPGIETNDVVDSGVSVPIPISPAGKSRANHAFSFDITLNGSEQLRFIPLGKETNVDLHSDWSDPSFDGAFLPDKRTVGSEGFDATWNILDLNRNYPQQWLGRNHTINNSSFGVRLLIPVNEYQKTMRSAKYAVMFIVLTFLVFFFVEVLNKKRIHPIQYLLVGVALCVFYTLLLSISEHTNFNFSYLISSIAVIVLITAYSKSIFKSRLLTVLQAIVLTALYGFMFITIQLQDYALLMGSLGVFIVLVVIMYLSRNVDWYAVTLKNDAEG